MDPDRPPRFRAAHAGGASWHDAVAACLAQLAPLPLRGGLGFLYVSDPFGEALDLILAQLREATGITAWVGSGAAGVCGGDREYVAEGAVAVLIADLAPPSFALFDGLEDGTADLDARLEAWARARGAALGVVHADPRQPHTQATLARFALATGAFLVGGIGSSPAGAPQIAGGPTEGGLSGVLLAPELPVVTGLSQGCSPIGPVHEVTKAHRNLVHSLDGRPALAVLKEEMGEILARQLGRVGGYIQVAFPVPGSGRADYAVRGLVAIDAARSVLAIGDEVREGQRLMFVRRDGASAQVDLERMLEDVRQRAAGRPVRGALYHACLGRGPNLFGPGSLELGRIQAALGHIPLAGFFAAGEIFHDRLYTYTGVLTLFL